MRARFIVILTGAGISAESGIPTFRDQGGLWQRYRLEDVATYEAFKRQPDLVHEFYFVAIGTSATVYPAAGFVLVAREAGAWCVELNLAPSAAADLFHEHLYGPATKVGPAFVERLLAGQNKV